MLGRFEVDVDECISAYDDLMKAIFEEKLRRVSFGWMGNIKSQFDSGKLKSAVKKVVTSHGLIQEDLFNNGAAGGCRV
jgi:hypothetical protein